MGGGDDEKAGSTTTKITTKGPADTTRRLSDTTVGSKDEPAVTLGDELAQKLRDAIHKEASSSHYSEAGRPAAVTKFLKDLFVDYGIKPDKGKGQEGRHRLMTKEGFLKAVDNTPDLHANLKPAEAGLIYDRLQKECQGDIDYKVVLRYISLDESDIRQLGKRFRTLMQAQGSNEKAFRKQFTKLAGGRDHLERGRIHERIKADFHVNLNERELEAFIKNLDVDGDGEVSPDDFVTFLRYTGDQLPDKSNLNTTTIVDIGISNTQEEEAALHRLGFQMLDTNLNADAFATSRCYLWYRRLSQVPPGTPASPLVDIYLHNTKVCSTLVAAGYVCVTRNVNRGPLARSCLYLWIKRAQTEEEAERDAILEVSVTTGTPRVREDKIWFPPSKDYIRVDGNLNERFMGQGVFLWFRPRSKRSLDIQKASPIKKMEVLSTTDKRLQVERHIKHHVRHYPGAWVRREGQFPRADFASLFNKNDPTKRGHLRPEAFSKLLYNCGCNVDKDELTFLINRLDFDSNGMVGREEFLAWLSLTMDEMDTMEEIIRQRFRLKGPELDYSNSRKYKLLKKRFNEFNAENNGVLSRSDIFRIAQNAGYLLSEPEVLDLQGRLDLDTNGKVDIWDFLRFLELGDDTSVRREKRVQEAAEGLREHILSRQDQKKKIHSPNQIDSETVWLDLVRRRHLNGHPTKGPVELPPDDIGHAVSRLGFRLSNHEHVQVCMRIDPSGSQTVGSAAFHAFASRTPKFIGEVFTAMESEVLKDLIDVYRYSGKKNRERYNTTLRLKAGEDATQSAMEDANLQYEEALDEVARELNPDEKGQLTAAMLRKNLLLAVGMSNSDLVNDEEVIALAQYVNADDVHTRAINVRKFLEGVVIYAEQLASGQKAETAHNYSLVIEAEDEEALIDVCIEIQQFLKEKSKLVDGTFDFKKAFDLFDEDHSGAITLIELKHMLEKQGILPRLEERTVLKLMERFDTSGEGLVTADEFKAFAERPFLALKAKVAKENNKAGGGKGGKGWQEEEDEKDPIKKLRLDKFAGKITGDRLTDLLVVDLMKGMLREKPDMEKLSLQELQVAFLACDPDRAGVITREEFFVALKAAKISLTMDVYNTTRLLEFFLEDEDLLDYDAIIHALARLRHLAYVKAHPPQAPSTTEVKVLSITGHVKLDGKIMKMREGLTRIMAGKENHETSALRRDPYRVFWKLDDDHDGKLSLSEFKKGLEKLDLGVKLTDQEARTVFRRMDKDRSKRVDYREFIEFFLTGDLTKLGKRLQHENKENNKLGYASATDSEEDDDDDDDDEEPTQKRQERIYKKVFDCLLDYEPNDTKRKNLQSILKKFDRGLSGMVSERRFRAFLYKCHIDLILSKSETRWLIRELDPDMNSAVDYVRFYERLLRMEAERDLALKKAAEEAEMKKKEDEEAAKKKKEDDEAAEKKKKEEEEAAKKKEEEAKKKHPGINVVAPILKRIFDAINVTSVKGRPYHVLFGLSDEMQTGLVSREAFEHTLSMMGCSLTKDDIQIVLNVLTPRNDNLVDYEDLYHLILRTPGVGLLVNQPYIPASGAPGATQRLSQTMRKTSVSPVRECMQSQRGLRWGQSTNIPLPFHNTTRMQGNNTVAPLPLNNATTPAFGYTSRLGATTANFLSTGALDTASRTFNAANMTAMMQATGTDMSINGSAVADDAILEAVGARVRCCMKDRVQQWGSNFSLYRQFEMSDTEHRGYLTKKDFQRVLQNLGAPLTPTELAHVVNRFDRYGDSMVDYGEFCRLMLVDMKEFDAIMRRLASKIQDVKRRGVNVLTTYEMMDMDGAGYVSAEDFREACRQLQLPATEVQLQTVMDYFGVLGDPDQIAYTDFLAYLSGMRLDGTMMTMTMSPMEMSSSYQSEDFFNPASQTMMNSTDFLPTSTRTSPQRQRSSLLMSGTKRALNWLCPVCYFAENVGSSLACEMCSSPNPSRRAMQIVQQCLNCSYQNGESLRECEMCGEPLPNCGKLRTKEFGTTAHLTKTMGGATKMGGWRTVRSNNQDNSSSDSEMEESPSRSRGPGRWRTTRQDVG